MSTQLRLVEVLPPASNAANARAAKEPRQRSGHQPRKTARTVAPTRRSVNWGDWRLDTRTRSVGRAGVAAARRALQEAAASDQLSAAS